MSLAATNYVLKRRFGNQTRKLLMVVMADYADEGGDSWPSIDTLANRAECSRRSAQEHLRVLEKAGEILIFTNAGKNGTNRYRIIFRKADLGDGVGDGVQDLHGGVQMSDAQTAGGGANERRPFAPEPLGTSYEPLGTLPLPPPGGVGAHAVASGDEELIRRLRGLREKWNGHAVLNHNEMIALRRNRHVFEKWTARDWVEMREFLNAKVSPGEAWSQWDVLKHFIANSAGAQAQARAWKRKQEYRQEGVKLAVVDSGEKATPEDMVALFGKRRVNS